MSGTPEFQNSQPKVCPQVNPALTDTDGMPLAPPEILTNPQGAWVVYNCAMDQATSFHRPTDQEKQHMTQLLTVFKTSKISGPTKETTKQIMDCANALNLVVCRIKNTKVIVNKDLNKTSVPDNVLLFYVKPGVKDYSGPFMMLRETKSSKFVIYGPHDDSDGTYAATKIGMINSYAVACFSNGHHRGYVSGGNINIYRESDFVHSGGVEGNLGTFAVNLFAQMYPGQVSILFNGCSHMECMYNKVKDHKVPEMTTAFKNAIKANTTLKNESQFTSYGPTFTIDGLVNTDYYIKCEIPVRIYMNNYAIVGEIAIEMEKNSWCW